jgi:NADH:ubiquinone oxidoreductase subunit F (NADH-binding)
MNIELRGRGNATFGTGQEVKVWVEGKSLVILTKVVVEGK